MSIKLNINVDLVELIKAFGINNLVNLKSGITDTSPNGNDRFVTISNSGQVVALYWHSTKRHTSSVDGKTFSRSPIANPGTWSKAIARSKMFGSDKTFYNSDILA